MVHLSSSWQSPHGRTLPAPGRRTLVMGILNVTPDSFSDGGQLATEAAILKRAGTLLEQGADVLDIGGESTRPGAVAVSETEEKARVVPAIRALRAQWPEVPLSIDTFKPGVAAAAVEAGVDIVNDVWGLTGGWESAVRRAAIAALSEGSGVALPASPMATLVAKLRCPVIAMHNRPDREYGDFWEDVLADLRLSLAVAAEAGIPKEQLWLDPGFGFAKSPAQNLEVLKRLERVVALGHPVLVGTSRKSTLGRVLGTDVDDRLEGTAATMAWAIGRGCAMIRVHDVKVMKRMAVMTDAIKAGIEWQGA